MIVQRKTIETVITSTWPCSQAQSSQLITTAFPCHNDVTRKHAFPLTVIIACIDTCKDVTACVAPSFTWMSKEVLHNVWIVIFLILFLLVPDVQSIIYREEIVAEVGIAKLVSADDITYAWIGSTFDGTTTYLVTLLLAQLH